jgi:small conductance mechanosensitive channel
MAQDTNPGKEGLKAFRNGISWWLLRIIPFFVLYLIVKFAFAAGYFGIFGSPSAQQTAHDFFVKFLVTICAFITVFAFQRYFIKFFRYFLTSFGKSLFFDSKQANNVSDMISRILLYLFYLIVLIVVLNIWSSTTFGWMLDLLRSGTVTMFSFVLGLFASSILGNVVAYYVLNRVKEIKPGDRVKVSDEYGDVMDIDFLFTHIRNLDNEIVSVPNIILVTKGIKNYSRYPYVVVHFELHLPHGLDFDEVKKAIISGVRKTKKILHDKPPEIWFKEANAWTIVCEVRAYTSNVMELVQVRGDILESVMRELRERKIPTGRDPNLYGNSKPGKFVPGMPRN